MTQEPKPDTAQGRVDRRRPAGLAQVVLLLAGLAGIVAWQTLAGLGHVDRMMAERSQTLYRMVATEVRNVARYGFARRERLDQVLSEIASTEDVSGVSLERTDGTLRLAHGVLPESPGPALRDGPHPTLQGGALVLRGPVRIEIRGCGGEASGCGGGCAMADEHGIEGDYVIALAINAAPYRHLRRTVWLQGGAGAILLLALGLGLWVYRRETHRSLGMREALASADERGRYLERLGRVAGGLAHEIKNPVGSLRGFAQLIAEHAPAGSREAEYAHLMVSELDAITRRVDRLRDFARPSPPDLRPLRPAEVIRKVAALLEPDLLARSLRLDLDLGQAQTEEPEALLDLDRFRDLVVNLVVNAIEASPESGTIVVRLGWDRRGDTLSLEVQDQGPGIPRAEREAALRPFHSTKPRGMGLGLAVAQQAIEDHGGRIEIADAPGGGALVRAVWPRRGTLAG